MPCCKLSEYWEYFLDFLEKFYKKRSLWNIRNKQRIINACLRMEKVHVWQVRKSWKPYHIHPYVVAQTYCMVHMHNVSERWIIAALLHDNIENAIKSWETENYDTIYTIFWLEDAVICETLSKPKNFDVDGEKHRDYFLRFKSISTLKAFIHELLIQKWEQLSSNEIAALAFKTALIKICDRIHNLRTMEDFSLEKIKEKVQETKKYLLPIAIEIWASHPRVLEQLEKAIIVAETVITRKEAEEILEEKKH